MAFNRMEHIKAIQICNLNESMFTIMKQMVLLLNCLIFIFLRLQCLFPYFWLLVLVLVHLHTHSPIDEQLSSYINHYFFRDDSSERPQK